MDETNAREFYGQKYDAGFTQKLIEENVALINERDELLIKIEELVTERNRPIIKRAVEGDYPNPGTLPTEPPRVQPGYGPLAEILDMALDQAQSGKGKLRHAREGVPWIKQPIMTEGRDLGASGPAFQARKKIREAINCPEDKRAIDDLLGAIVYTAACARLRIEKMVENADEMGQMK